MLEPSTNQNLRLLHRPSASLLGSYGYSITTHIKGFWTCGRNLNIKARPRLSQLCNSTTKLIVKNKFKNRKEGSKNKKDIKKVGPFISTFFFLDFSFRDLDFFTIVTHFEKVIGLHFKTMESQYFSIII